MFFHNTTYKKRITCNILTFFEDLSFLNPKSHLKETQDKKLCNLLLTNMGKNFKRFFKRWVNE